MKLPFKENRIDDFSIRVFSNQSDQSEFVWHRDLEDRLIESVNITNWKIQLDNELPIIINHSILIPKGVYHRLIKGDGDLTLKIKFLK